MIGIYGASGFIGKHLMREFQQQGMAVMGTCNTHHMDGLVSFDILKDDFAVFNACQVVIIAGAYTDMGLCARNKDLSEAINVKGTGRLIQYLHARNIKPVFLSSNQVFSGDKGQYVENDIPDPRTTYGKQKLAIENLIQELGADYLILRLSKVFSYDEAEDSLYSQIASSLRNGEVVKAAYNQVYNPTDVGYLCRMIRLAVVYDMQGLYHLVEGEAISRFDFASRIAKDLGLALELVQPLDILTLSLNEFPPLNGGLVNEKFLSELSVQLQNSTTAADAVELTKYLSGSHVH